MSNEEVPLGDKAEGTDICMVCRFTPDKCICSGPRTSDELFPATWYCIERYSTDIKPVTVYKATDHFLTINDVWAKGKQRRVARDFHFRDWESARSALIAREMANLRYHQSEIDRCHSRIMSLHKMVKP